MTTPRNQIEAVSRVGIGTVPILNGSERGVFDALDHCLGDRPDLRLTAQTGLGEVIRPTRSSADAAALGDALACVNSKRLDFAVVDTAGTLVLAIEYHGRGHRNATNRGV